MPQWCTTFRRFSRLRSQPPRCRMSPRRIGFAPAAGHSGAAGKRRSGPPAARACSGRTCTCLVSGCLRQGLPDDRDRHQPIGRSRSLSLRCPLRASLFGWLKGPRPGHPLFSQARTASFARPTATISSPLPPAAGWSRRASCRNLRETASSLTGETSSSTARPRAASHGIMACPRRRVPGRHQTVRSRACSRRRPTPAANASRRSSSTDPGQP